MKHLTMLSVVVLVIFATYLTINIDSKFWYGEDLTSTIFAFFIGVIATLTIILTLKMIYERKDNGNKDDVG